MRLAVASRQGRHLSLSMPDWRFAQPEAVDCADAHPANAPADLGVVVIAFIAALLTAVELDWEVRAVGVVLIGAICWAYWRGWYIPS
jgi:hypothetical protein